MEFIEKFRVVLQVQDDGFFLRDYGLLGDFGRGGGGGDFGNGNHLFRCPSLGMRREGLALI